MSRRSDKAHSVLKCVHCYRSLEHPMGWDEVEDGWLSTGKPLSLICPVCSGGQRVFRVGGGYVVVEGFDPHVMQPWKPHHRYHGRYIERVPRKRPLYFVQKRRIVELAEMWYPPERIAEETGVTVRQVKIVLAREHGRKRCSKCKKQRVVSRTRRRAYS
jgi:hypothetical protein